MIFTDAILKDMRSDFLNEKEYGKDTISTKRHSKA